MVLYLHIILASIHVCLSSFVYTVKPIWSQDFCSVWVRAAQTLTRQVPGLAFLVLGLLMAQHCCAESRCHWDISTQPLSSTHSVPVSLHSECLVVWRFKHLRWGDLRVELEVKWDKCPRNPKSEKKRYCLSPIWSSLLTLFDMWEKIVGNRESQFCAPIINYPKESRDRLKSLAHVNQYMFISLKTICKTVS